ncbi:MAG: DUF962 domain-containing protein [Spirochaetes bacterium]|nr:DUF962 domain-containing protein [Spirochaetota bacterium]
MKNKKVYSTFREFYPFYISQHQNTICRVLHYIGSWLVLIILVAGAWTGNFIVWILMPAAGYGFAWIGHFFFEKNRPATFTYPIYSLMGDWVMWWQFNTGKMSFKAKRNN